MHWFTGPIADAIAQARSTKSYFVVYVKGTDGDAKTEEFTSLLNSEEMTSILDTENFVKIQLTLDTPECSQFSQIYPVILVPSMYFIDQQGSPVEVIGGHIGLEQLRDRILKLISKPEEVVPSVNKPEVTSTSQTLTDIESASLSEVPPGSLGSAPATSKETSDNQLATQDLDSSLKGADTAYTTHGLHHEAEDEPQIKKAKESGNVQDVNMETGGSDIAVKIDNGSADSSNENTAVHDVAGDVTSERGASVSGSLSLEERVEKARQLAEVIRFKKEREEKEKEKRIEIERRETLKNIQKFKREQEEKEMRELAEQRKKEKEADRLAREKVKKQIEQDRIDKAAKFSMQKHSDAELQKEAEAKKQAEAQAKSAAEAAARSCARIQFRLPDGSVLTNLFQAESRFDEVYCFLHQQQNFPFRNFRLLTTYPRREFGNDDRTRTFQELQLAPSASILVIPSTEVTRHGGEGMMSSLIQMLAAPLITLFGYIRLFIFGTALPPAPATENQVPRQRDSSAPLNRNDENSDATSSSGVRRRNTDSGSTSRREGNVHRFVNRQDEDDENNTWNGNSTQQM
ncbi:UBX domain-containing protein 4-like isoform X2 [Artemia franciscana]|uniref:UBX domain-containing protein 4-like isoform X2 n=1 Tax=Artemia franciscana TaxID=6661 RepID=UPI0032DB9F3D